MSNQIVGNIYQTVIDAVINECRDDFQENGIDEMTLQELKEGWQTKLSSLQVAQMPWDSIPEPEANEQLMYQQPPPIGGGPQQPGQVQQPGGISVPGQQQQHQQQQPQVVAPNDGGYGGMPSLHTPQQPGLVLPGSHQGNQGNGQPGNPVKLEQTDGAAVFEPAKKKKGVVTVEGEIVDGVMTLKVPQTDGAEDDEDELNSDLDDSSDDNLSGNEDEDDSHGNTILCVYDRIHRVKNNRKFTFRDGIVNVNRKDYVFGKATGESEW
ncbi:Transcription initiation factor IIA large subunit [Yarrowia sp. C11]|nr:Transcription initiation factor IIA large subunit [Yarrowia sp. E02]KAG5373427.1 Transcription initiation factor IIA large subunit [Yarrowia sp. C11]